MNVSLNSSWTVCELSNKAEQAKTPSRIRRPFFILPSLLGAGPSPAAGGASRLLAQLAVPRAPSAPAPPVRRWSCAAGPHASSAMQPARTRRSSPPGDCRGAFPRTLPPTRTARPREIRPTPRTNPAAEAKMAYAGSGPDPECGSLLTSQPGLGRLPLLLLIHAVGPELPSWRTRKGCMQGAEPQQHAHHRHEMRYPRALIWCFPPEGVS